MTVNIRLVDYIYVQPFHVLHEGGFLVGEVGFYLKGAGADFFGFVVIEDHGAASFVEGNCYAFDFLFFYGAEQLFW